LLLLLLILMHWPLQQACVVQTLPHAPQLVGSLVVSTQACPHSVWPGGQVDTHTPPEHCWPSAQALPQ
jgi:hypothetical protein